ncbi:hypothetical protein HDU76_002117 [Blyttiomyces sp. JEL0837]|nr:hypothetical protein HDU76_002117 [Blyttiomyces sp. JEL0837]
MGIPVTINGDQKYFDIFKTRIHVNDSSKGKYFLPFPPANLSDICVEFKSCSDGYNASGLFKNLNDSCDGSTIVTPDFIEIGVVMFDFVENVMCAKIDNSTDDLCYPTVFNFVTASLDSIMFPPNNTNTSTIEISTTPSPLSSPPNLPPASEICPYSCIDTSLTFITKQYFPALVHSSTHRHPTNLTTQNQALTSLTEPLEITYAATCPQITSQPLIIFNPITRANETLSLNASVTFGGQLAPLGPSAECQWSWLGFVGGLRSCTKMVHGFSGIAEGGSAWFSGSQGGYGGGDEFSGGSSEGGHRRPPGGGSGNNDGHEFGFGFGSGFGSFGGNGGDGDDGNDTDSYHYHQMIWDRSNPIVSAFASLGNISQDTINGVCSDLNSCDTAMNISGFYNGIMSYCEPVDPLGWIFSNMAVWWYGSLNEVLCFDGSAGGQMKGLDGDDASVGAEYCFPGFVQTMQTVNQLLHPPPVPSKSDPFIDPSIPPPQLPIIDATSFCGPCQQQILDNVGVILNKTLWVNAVDYSLVDGGEGQVTPLEEMFSRVVGETASLKGFFCNLNEADQVAKSISTDAYCADAFSTLTYILDTCYYNTGLRASSIQGDQLIHDLSGTCKKWKTCFQTDEDGWTTVDDVIKACKRRGLNYDGSSGDDRMIGSVISVVDLIWSGVCGVDGDGKRCYSQFVDTALSILNALSRPKNDRNTDLSIDKLWCTDSCIQSYRTNFDDLFNVLSEQSDVPQEITSQVYNRFISWEKDGGSNDLATTTTTSTSSTTTSTISSTTTTTSSTTSEASTLTESETTTENETTQAQTTTLTVSTATSEQTTTPVLSTATSEPSTPPILSTATSEPSTSPVLLTATSEPSTPPVPSAATSEPSISPVPSTATSETSISPVPSTATSEVAVNTTTATPSTANETQILTITPPSTTEESQSSEYNAITTTTSSTTTVVAVSTIEEPAQTGEPPVRTSEEKSTEAIVPSTATATNDAFESNSQPNVASSTSGTTTGLGKAVPSESEVVVAATVSGTAEILSTAAKIVTTTTTTILSEVQSTDETNASATQFSETAKPTGNPVGGDGSGVVRKQVKKRYLFRF